MYDKMFKNMYEPKEQEQTILSKMTLDGAEQVIAFDP